MKQKYINITLFALFIVITTITYVVFDNITKDKINLLKHHKYSAISQELKNKFYTLVDEKKNATLAIALLLSHDTTLKEALLYGDRSKIDLELYGEQLKKSSDFKNTWFHLINKDGISIKKSWINKYNNSVLNARPDVVKMIKNPHIMTSIGVGKFDFTFRAMVPIYDNDKFIGIFEVITHFNSIVKKLEKNGVKAIVIADKKYKKQLAKPFSNIFIDDYYIANKHLDSEIFKIVSSKGVEYFINQNKEYIIDEQNGYLVIPFKFTNNTSMLESYIILFKPLGTIDMSKVTDVRARKIFYVLILILVVGLILYYIASKRYHNHLTKDKIRMKLILDAQPYIMILKQDEQILEINKEFLNFFDQYETKEAFLSEHSCICDKFEKVDDPEYIYSKYINDKYWLEYVLDNHDKVIKVAIAKDEKLYHFIVKVSQTDILEGGDNSRFIVVVLVDITAETEAVHQLASKEKLLAHQSKMAAMGEMIGNIAHQWRQPLSVISVNAMDMKLKKEYGLLTDEYFYAKCDNINDQTQYLSRTIDDFRNFLIGDKHKTDFDIKKTIESFLHLIEGSFKTNDIELILDIEDDIIVTGYESELIQCFINIVNNSKDALKENPDIQKRLIFISAYKKGDKKYIIFKDNAGGIPNHILPKIFEPYFTTKHQSKGTGLGLHMTYNIIVNGMKGDIEATNKTYQYQNETYKGAEFKIIL